MGALGGAVPYMPAGPGSESCLSWPEPCLPRPTAGRLQRAARQEFSEG